MKQTRGIRNNNPFNIVISNSKWVGKIPIAQNTDGRFEQFSEMEFGVRAGIKLIKIYYQKGYKTVRQIITRYAPPIENQTEAYIRFCESIMKDDEFGDSSLMNFCITLARAICWYESKYDLPREQALEICKKFRLFPDEI